MKRSAPLDLLRTIAIALVFTSHFNAYAGEEWFHWIGQFSWAGVDLFFVLSGYLITWQLLDPRHPQTTAEFYLRRSLRIWPNYFVVLFLYLLIPAFTERGVLPPLWRFFTFTQNFGLESSTQGTYSHAWSLCVEEQFYLVLPFLLPLFRRRLNLSRSVALFAGLVVAGIALRAWLWVHYASPFWQNGGPVKGIGPMYYREIYYPTYCRWDGLAAGVGIAALRRLRPVAWEKLARFGNGALPCGAALAGVGMWLSIAHYSFAESAFSFSAADLGFALIVFAALAEGSWLSRVKVPGARAGATLAFSFYLTHKQMIHISQAWLQSAGVTPASILYPLGILATCLATAAVLYLCVERPFLLLRDRLLEYRSNRLMVAAG